MDIFVKIRFMGSGMGSKMFSDLDKAKEFAADIYDNTWVESVKIVKNEQVVVEELGEPSSY